MTIPFWPPRPVWTRAVRAARAVLLATDFDGTLSRLAARPDDAVPAPGIRRALERLRSRAIVAVISGRARIDVRRRLGLPRAIYVGDHGGDLKGLGLRRNLAPARSRALASRWARSWRHFFRKVPGVVVEEKPTGVAIHYRQVRGRNRIAFERRISSLRSSVLAPGWGWLSGSRVWEWRRTGETKGRALEWLWKELGHPFLVVVGDDLTDEDMFRVGRRRGLTIKVGPGPTGALARVSTLDGVRRLLKWLGEARS